MIPCLYGLKKPKRVIQILFEAIHLFFSLFIWLFNFITKFFLNKIIKITCEKSFDYAIFSK
jgi:CBS domain containing-hemolysin-like protein